MQNTGGGENLRGGRPSPPKELEGAEWEGWGKNL